jgi:hypothetical protein
MNKPGKRRQHEGPKNRIIKILALDEGQKKAYLNLVDIHHNSILKQAEAAEALKNELYMQLTTGDTATADSLLNKLSQMHRTIELAHYKHFMDIKTLCKPEQMDKYEQLTQELTRLFNKKRRK